MARRYADRKTFIFCILRLFGGYHILQIRLDKAAELLKNMDITVTEACYRIGIDSPSCFSKAFKVQFGVSPSEFVKQ
jgi:AraC-like DNA-binding protein